MRFRILGPVRLSRRTPTAAKPRVVLATLLVQNNNVVSTHGLIDELWGVNPPRTAATTLQVYVSQLRKALLEGSEDGAEQAPSLLTQPPGYLMRVAPDELDLTVFESLRARGRAAYGQGDHATASRLLGESLELWSGAALSGIPHGPSLQSTAIRLEELRSEVLEQRISADLKLGRHQELIGELMALAHEFPMRETLHGLLMVALYRSGRQSDAVQAFHRVRRTLVDELGVEPDASLKRILDRVLACDPALAWNPGRQPRRQPDRPRAAAAPRRTGGAGDPAAAPSGPVVWLPPALTDFTGRDEELARYARLLARSRTAAAPRAVAVSGLPGVGKTALAVQLAHRADGFTDGRILLAMRDSEGRPRTPRAVLSTLLRRLLRPGSGPDPLPADPEELADLLHHLTRGRDLLLLLDDAVSEAQVRPLLSAVPDASVVITCRRPLDGLEQARHLVLDVLDQQAAEALLRANGGPRMTRDPAAVAEIARLCGGLPLALRVAAGAIAARPHRTPADLARRLGDEPTRLAALSLGDLDVRRALRAAYREAPEAERLAFRTLGPAPLPDFPLWMAQALLGLPPDTAEERLEGLVRAHLLQARRGADGGEPVRYGYHTLLRSLAMDLPAEDGAEADTADTAAARLGRACLVRARAADARLTPGRDLLAGVLVPEAEDLDAEDPAVAAPLRWLRTESARLLDVLRRLHAQGLWDLVCALASAMGGYYEACALWDDWETSHELALDAARRCGNPLAEAALLRSLGTLSWQRRDNGRAVDRYRRAARLFAQAGDAAKAARCLTGEADVLLGQKQPERAGALYRRALARARAMEDAWGCVDARRGLALVALVQGRPADSLASLAACETVAGTLGDLRWHGYVRRTADWIRTISRDGTHLWSRLEVRPGVWLMNALPAAAGAD